MSPSDSNRERLPIKLVMPKQGVERRVPGGGSPPVPFRPVSEAMRQGLVRQVHAIGAVSGAAFKEVGGVTARVRLIPNALAKSHRPRNLFNEDTCPIIGGGSIGELFVKVTEPGLEQLTELLAGDSREQSVKEISSIEMIEIVTPSYRRGGINSFELLKKSPTKKDRFRARIKLFDWGENRNQEALVDNFRSICSKFGIHPQWDGYAASSYVCSVDCRDTADIDLLSGIIGVRSIQGMPIIRASFPGASAIAPLPKLPSKDPGNLDLPTVVVVDTGVSVKIDALNSWVVGRTSTVSPKTRNTSHGTFVAGLIAWGSFLNGNLKNIDNNPCCIYDLNLVPNADPAFGAIELLFEDEFLGLLENALQEHSNSYKVWNLSLGSNSVCSPYNFSQLAEELDNLQEKYQVSFVISAGNYERPPLLDFPRSSEQLELGRITSPADSVLGIAVGSIAGEGVGNMGPNINQVSPFSRNGPGPNHVIKPDFVHYGGNCSTDCSKEIGVMSVGEDGIHSGVGTSYAAPLVSKTLAQIYHQVTPAPSPVLARALLTHHARDPRSGLRVPDGEELYYGFGVPAPVPYSLECTPYSSTLVFDDVLRPGYFLEWDDFPYPSSLTRDGRYFGEIWMTLAMAPTRGARWGNEYCETHIDAHFGVYKERVSRKTGEVKTIFTGLVPAEHKNAGKLFELYQIEKLRKWAPVRTYYGNLGDKGEKGNRWRLKLQLLSRHEDKSEQLIKPQPFSLIVTIADPEKKAPVYDEMARIALHRFKSQNLAIRTATRIQTRR